MAYKESRPPFAHKITPTLYGYLVSYFVLMDKIRKLFLCFEFSLSIFVALKCVTVGSSQKCRIVSQAAEMFAAQGLKSVRMDDIARELSISKRTLYEMFSDKEELIYLSMKSLFERSCSEMSEISSKANDVLEALFMALQKINNDSTLQRRIEGNLKKFYPAVYEKIRQEGVDKNQRSLKAMIERGINEGLFLREMNIEVTMRIFYGVATTLKSSIITKEMVDVNEIEVFYQVVTMLFRGISTQKGVELIEKYQRAYPSAKYE